MRARATLFATAIAVVGLSACKDSGLPDRNLPLDEAAHRPPDALVQAVHPETRPGGGMPNDPTHAAAAGMPADEVHAAMPDDAAHAGVSMATRPITVGEQTFVAAGRPVNMDAASLRQVGGMGGMSFSAARGDDAPYDRLYLSHGTNQYVVYEPVHDASGDPNARAATMQHGLESGAAGAH